MKKHGMMNASVICKEVFALCSSLTPVSKKITGLALSKKVKQS